MELIRREGEQFVFRLSRREKQLLFHTLKFYPLTPTSHFRLSRTTAPTPSEDQALLEETMSDLQRERRGKVDLLLANTYRLVEDGNHFRLTLDLGDIEWLLQVLNDVRVGSWLRLGCPDPDEGKLPVLEKKNFAFLVAMDLSARFESLLLEVLDQDQGPELQSGADAGPGRK